MYSKYGYTSVDNMTRRDLTPLELLATMAFIQIFWQRASYCRESSKLLAGLCDQTGCYQFLSVRLSKLSVIQVPPSSTYSFSIQISIFLFLLQSRVSIQNKKKCHLFFICLFLFYFDKKVGQSFEQHQIECTKLCKQYIHALVNYIYMQVKVNITLKLIVKCVNNIIKNRGSSVHAPPIYTNLFSIDEIYGLYITTIYTC